MPATVEPEEASTSAEVRRPCFARRLVFSVLRLSLILALAVLISAGYYLARKGFGRQWRSLVVQELHHRGVEASVRRLTLDPFRGLIARDVRIFDYKDHETTLALISEVSFDINYAALFHRQPFLNAIDIRDAQITFPFRV